MRTSPRSARCSLARRNEDEGPRLAPETLPPRPRLARPATADDGTAVRVRASPQPHSEYPHAWHFLHPSANSSWLEQSGQVPMKISASAA
jgi:hypothetical protein